MLKAKRKVVSLLTACLTLLFAFVLGFTTLLAPTPVTTANAATTVTDVLNREITGVPAKDTYVSWSGKTANSSAVYAGQSAGGNDSIQLRSNNNNSGIITTTSGGKAKKVVVEWNDSTTSGRTLNIYRKDTAYSSSADLYSSSTQGTLIGTIVKGTSTELTISGDCDYEYIGMRSASGAMYLTSITITWDNGPSTCEHANKTTTTVDATCTDAGSITVTCDDCGEEISRETTAPATGHVNTTTTTIDATCTDAGSITVTCDDCGETVSTETISATGHNYVDGICTVCGEDQPSVAEATLTFDDKAKRTEYSTSKQVWVENGITLTNTGSGLGDYANPARFYKNSKIVIECTSMKKIDFYCNTESYATALKNSIGNGASASGKVVTVELGEVVNEFTATLSVGQVRMDSITVTYEKASSEPDPTPDCEHANISNPDYSHTNNQHITSGVCSDCGETVELPVDCTFTYKYNSNDNKTHDTVSVCSVCEETVTTTENVACTFGEGVVEGTVATYTCQYCEYSYTEEVETWTIEFSVPNGATPIEAISVKKGNSIDLPSANAIAPYVFVGWTAEKYTDTSVAPVLLSTSYTPEDDVTLYALYQCGGSAYVKVTKASTDWSGTYLIVYEDGNVAFNGGLTTLDAVSNTIDVEITDSKIAANDTTNAAAFTIGADGIQSASGYYIGQTSNANGLKSSTTTTYANTLSLNNDGSVNIVSDGAYLRYNATSGQDRFRYYKSDTYTNQKAIALYKLIEADSYYVADFANIDSASLTLGDSLAMNYYVALPTAFENATMYFTFNGNTYDVAGVLEGGRYVFTLNEIAPQYMGENIKAELKFGEVVLDVEENYSIKTYAQNKLNAEDSSDELKRLVSDMLYYGAEAQNYVGGYTTNELASSGVDKILPVNETETPTSTDFTLNKNTEIASYSVYFKNATLWFGDVNKICISLSSFDENVTLTIDGTPVELTGTTVLTEGLLPTEFDKTYTFKLYYNDGNSDVLMQTLTYSVNAYAFAKKEGANISELALALYRYGKSAEAYA